MAYLFQTFSVGQVLTAAQMNQVEVNIRDHKHGIDNVSNGSGIAVAAYNSVTDTNVTGNAESPTVDLDTEIFDLNGDFAGDTFTAAVTGKYLVCAGIYLTDLSASHTQASFFVTASNRRYDFWRGSPGPIRGAGANQLMFNGAMVIDMDAGDTLTLGTQVENGASVVDVGTGSATVHLTYLQVVLIA